VNERLPYGVNHYLCTVEMSVPMFLDIVEEAGFESVGLTQRALAEMPLPALRRELAARQLEVSSLNSAGFFLGATEPAQQAINGGLIVAAAELGARVLNVLPGYESGASGAASRQAVTDSFGALAAAAAAADVRLALEPLHATRARIKSCVNTIGEATDIIATAVIASLNLDLFHLSDDDALDTTADGAGPPLGLVQICDIGGPARAARRLPLDEGTVDWRSFVRRIRTSHPDVPIELELFADQLPGRSSVEIIESAARLLAAGAGR